MKNMKNKIKYAVVLALAVVIGSSTGYLQNKFDIFGNNNVEAANTYSSTKDMAQQESHPPIKEAEGHQQVTKNVDGSGKMKVSAYPETYVYPDTLHYDVNNGKITGHIKVNDMGQDSVMDFEIYLRTGIMKTAAQGSPNWLETNPIRPQGSESRYYVAKYVVDVMRNNNSAVLDHGTYELMTKRY